MFARIWRFRVRAGFERQFEEAYGPAGDWARLFRTGTGHLATELLRDVATPGMYLTIDRWESGGAWTRFRNECRHAYESVDRHCAELTTQDGSLGEYDEWDSHGEG